MRYHPGAVHTRPIYESFMYVITNDMGHNTTLHIVCSLLKRIKSLHTHIFWFRVQQFTMIFFPVVARFYVLVGRMSIFSFLLLTHHFPLFCYSEWLGLVFICCTNSLCCFGRLRKALFEMDKYHRLHRELVIKLGAECEMMMMMTTIKRCFREEHARQGNRMQQSHTHTSLGN